ncbi:hypothetical protein ACJZ2D_010188 [Fusarium nematophilum]
MRLCYEQQEPPCDMLCPPISTWLAKIKDRTRQRDIESHTGQHDSQPPVETTEDDELLFPSWPPLNPREMLSRQAFYKDRMKHRKYRAPMGIFTDSPLYALYRLYEWIMADHTVNMRNELELFWWNR